MRSREVGRAVRNRVALNCERLESRETPSSFPLDPAFGSAGKVLDTQANAPTVFSQVVVEADGKILAAGDGVGPHGSRPVVARFNRDGTPDRTFGSNGIATFDFHSYGGHVDSLAVEANGKIVVAGSPATFTTAYRPSFELARLNDDGSLDYTFGRDGRVTASFGGDLNYNAFATDVGLPNGVAVQADGKIVVTGAAALRNGNGQDQLAIAIDRFNVNGSLDSSFHGSGQVVTRWTNASPIPEAVAVQADGKIDVAGTLYSTDGHSGPGFFVARYNKDGSTDTTFHNGDGKVGTSTHTGSGATATAMVLQKDGKILVVGSLDAGFAVERFTANGQVDTSFDGDGIASAPFASGHATGVAVQADGKILLGGTALDPATRHDVFALARFTTAGKLDSSFGSGGMTSDNLGQVSVDAQALALESNGNVVLGGSVVTGKSVAALASFKTTASTTIPPPVKSSTTFLTASTKTSAFGQWVTFTATVAESGSSADPTGTVTFKEGSTVLGTVNLVDGKASLSWGRFALGNHTVTAVYSGASGVRWSTSNSATLAVGRAPLQIWAPTVNPTSPTVGGPVTLSVGVGLVFSGATTDPTGTITFRDGNTILGTVPLKAHGLTQLTLSSLPAGTHHITAVYSGNANFVGGTSSATTVTVAPRGAPTTRVTLENVGNITKAGSALLILIKVTPTWGTGIPDGWITLFDGTRELGQYRLDTTGKTAAAKAGGLSAGRHTLTAVYSGAVHFQPGTGTLYLTLS